MVHRIPALSPRPSSATPAALVATAVMARLRGAWTKPDFRPATVPAVAARIVSISQSRAWDAESAASLLRIDPMFAAQVLRAASTHRPVRSLQQAVQVLGSAGMRRQLLEFAAGLRVLGDRATCDAIASIHRAGWRRAEVVRSICRYTTIDTEAAATGALLADMGLVAGLIAGSDSPAGFTPPSLHELWNPVCEGHESIGWYLAESWGLADDLALIIGNHHELSVGGTLHPTLAALALSDAVLEDLGLDLRIDGVPAPNTVSPNRRLIALRALGMTRKQYRLARQHARSRLMA
jgi:HD-like signal output (HDOD) protein